MSQAQAANNRLRSKHHASRVFLASSTRHYHDSRPGKEATFPYKLRVGGITGDVVASATSLQVAIFDQKEKEVVSSIETVVLRPGQPFEPKTFHFHCPSRCTLIFEVVAGSQGAPDSPLSPTANNRPDGNERSMGWSHLPLVRNDSGSKELPVLEGSASLLLLGDLKLQPLLAGLSRQGKLTVDIEELRQSEEALDEHIPSCTIVPEAFLNPRVALKDFDVELGALRITAKPNCEYQMDLAASVFVHNSYMQLSEELHDIQLESHPGANGARTWTVAKDSMANRLTFTALPLHPNAHLVLCVRPRGQGDRHASQAVAVAAVPLCPNPSLIEDADVEVQNVPVLHGPFRGGPSKKLVVPPHKPTHGQPGQQHHHAVHWYGDAHMVIDLRLAYFNTPKAAPIVEDPLSVAPSKPAAKVVTKKPAVQGHTKPAHEAGSSEVPVSSMVGGEPRQVEDDPEATEENIDPSPVEAPTGALAPPRPAAPTLTPGVGTQQPQSGITSTTTTNNNNVTNIIAQPDPQIYEMLVKLQAQLDEMQHTLTAPPVAPSQIQQSEAAAAAADAEPVQVELVNLAPRTQRICGATRISMRKQLITFTHPTTNERLTSDNAVTRVTYSKTHFALRLDGVTLPPAAQDRAFPASLEGRLSFGGLKEQVMGPMKLVHCGDDANIGRSFTLASRTTGDHGVIWHESNPVDNHADSTSQAKYEATVLREVKQRRHATICIHLYDEVSRFYVATAEIPITAFDRPANMYHNQVVREVALTWDPTLSPSGSLYSSRADHHPLASSCGTLHFTTCSVGTQAAHTATTRCDPSSPKGLFANRIYVPKLADVTDEGLPPTGGRNKPEMNQGTEAPSAVRSSSEGPAPSEIPASSEGPSAAPSSAPVKEQMPDWRRDIHSRRAQFVKQSLLKQQPAIPLAAQNVNHMAEQQQGNGGADRVEMDFRLKMVDKKRDELKCQKIAECLRQRITTDHEVTLASGIPHVVSTLFKNPYPATMTFKIQIDHLGQEGGPVRLDIKSDFGTHFTLGPKEELPVPVVATMTRATSGSTPPIACEIYTDNAQHPELMQIVRVHCFCCGPMIQRRVEAWGEPDKTTKVTYFLRPFTPEGLNMAPVTSRTELAQLSRLVGRMCMSSKASDTHIVSNIDHSAQFDPFATSAVAAWEEVEVSFRAPSASGAHSVLLHFYKDDACQQHSQTWELVVRPVIAIGAGQLEFGQMNPAFLIPIPCDSVFASGSHCEAKSVKQPDGVSSTVHLRVKPRRVGPEVITLHVFNRGELTRYNCQFNVVVPEPTMSLPVNLTLEQCMKPVKLSLTVANRELVQRAFRIEHNFRHMVTVRPSNVIIGPQEQQNVDLMIRAQGAGPDGDCPAEFPIRLFVNEAESDRTVDSYLVDLKILAAPPALQ